MTFSDFYRFLESQGWELRTGSRRGTKHYKYVHPNSPFPIPVGRHPSQEIGPVLLNQMLRETGLKEAFRKWRNKK